MIEERYVSFDEFKPIKGFENYLISKNGEVYSLKTRKFLKFHDRKGYLGFAISVNNKRKDLALHRMLAETFIPNPNNLPQVNHKDGNKQNNDLLNLEWCTCSYNVQHAYDNGLAHGHHLEYTPELREKLGKGMRGKHHSESTKSILRQKMLGRYVSEDTKIKRSKTCKSKGVEFWSQHFKSIPRSTKHILDTVTNKEYNSITIACSELSFPRATMQRWLKKERRFKYVD